MIGDLVRRLVHKNSELENTLVKERLIQQHAEMKKQEEQEHVTQELKTLQSKADATHTEEESKLKTSYDQLNAQYDKLLDESLAVEATLKDYKRDIESKDKEIQKRDAEIEKLKNHNKSWSIWRRRFFQPDQNEQLIERLDEAYQEKSDLQVQLEEANAQHIMEIEKLNTELKSLKDSNNALSAGLQKQGVDDLVAQIEELKTLYANEKETNKTLVGKIEQLQRQYEDEKVANQAVSDELQKLEENLKGVDVLVEQQKTTFAEQDAELKALRADNEALSVVLQGLETNFQKVDVLVPKMKELKHLYENEKDKNQKLRDLGMAWWVYYYRMYEQLEQVQSENMDFKAQIEKLTNTLHDYQQQETGESSGSDNLMSGIKLSHENVALSRQICDLKYENQKLEDRVRKLQLESSPAAAGSLPDQAQQEIKRLNRLLTDSIQDPGGKKIIAKLNEEISHLRFQLQHRRIYEDDIQGTKLREAHQKIDELQKELQNRDES